jgi:hypothetical protein
VATLEVYPRETPAERADALVPVEVDEDLAVHAATLEEWVAPRQNWEVTLRQGHDFDRTNNVEARIIFVAGEQTSSLTFRLDQLTGAEDTGAELVLRFEEQEGVAKLARLTANGLDLELFHILSYT